MKVIQDTGVEVLVFNKLLAVEAFVLGCMEEVNVPGHCCHAVVPTYKLTQELHIAQHVDK